ncbi:hypothetical protein Tco_1172196, partial [Tanacetum coccineum]
VWFGRISGLELLSFDDLYYKLKTLEVDIKGYSTFSLSQSAGPSHSAFFPYLKKDEYEVWAMKMEYWITNNDMNIWKVIQNGNSLKRTGRDRDGRVIILPPTTADEHIAVQRESKARTTLLQSIPDDHVADFHYMDDARDIWNAVKARFGGNAKSKKMRKSMLKQEFSEFRISEVDGLYKGYDRMQKILSQLNQIKAKPEDEDINLKFLRALPSSWSQVALTLKTKGGLELLSFDDLYYKLKTLEVDIKGYSTFSLSQSAGLSHSAFVSTTSASKKMSYADSPSYTLSTYTVPSNSKTGSYRSGTVFILIHKDGDGDASFQLESNSLPHAHAQTTKTYYKHQDSRIMKAQELKTKTSAQTLIYKIFLQRYQVYQGRLLASFQDDAKYEHVGQDTRSQGGKDDQDGRIKI